MATQKNIVKDESEFASSLPDDMIAGGLPTDFDGTILAAHYVKWDYAGTRSDNPSLAARLKIRRDDLDDDDKGKVIVQYWSAGSLAHFAPADANGNLLDEEVRDGEGNENQAGGVYAKKVGSRTQLNDNTNWAQFTRSCLDSNLPREEFSPNITFLVGVKGHFNRLPPDKKRGEMKADDGDKSGGPKDVLCMTEYKGRDKAVMGGKGVGAGAGAAKSGSSTKTAPSASAAGSGDVDDKLRDIVRQVLAENDGQLPKAKLPGLVLKAAAADKDKGKYVKRVSEVAFLESLAEGDEPVAVLDADEGTITAL